VRATVVGPCIWIQICPVCVDGVEGSVVCDSLGVGLEHVVARKTGIMTLLDVMQLPTCQGSCISP
jgi:hypothetical protein